MKPLRILTSSLKTQIITVTGKAGSIERHYRALEGLYERPYQTLSGLDGPYQADKSEQTDDEQFGEEDDDDDDQVANTDEDDNMEQVAKTDEQWDDEDYDDNMEQVADTDEQRAEDEDDDMEQVVQTWKQWGEDEDVTTALLAKCEKYYNDRGLGPQKPDDGKRWWPKGSRGRGSKKRAGVQCMLMSYETYIV